MLAWPGLVEERVARQDVRVGSWSWLRSRWVAGPYNCHVIVVFWLCLEEEIQREKAIVRRWGIRCPMGVCRPRIHHV